VDIDLTYLPVEDRASSLVAIDAALRRIADKIRSGIAGARVTAGTLTGGNIVTKHFVEADGVQIKIEVTPVLRVVFMNRKSGQSRRPSKTSLGRRKCRSSALPISTPANSVAALDRQHPRDLFDVRDLLAHEGIDEALRKAFVVYLLSHNRPMAEVLAPARLDIAQEFTRGFAGMTDDPVTLEELLQTREEFIRPARGKMSWGIVGSWSPFEKGEPEWGLLDVPGVEKLPAVQWRLQNLAKIDPRKRQQLVEDLRKALAMTE